MIHSLLSTCLLLCVFSYNLFAQSSHAYVLGDAVRVRAAPNSKADLIEELNFGAHVTVIQKNDKSDNFGGENAYFWVEVNTEKDHRGWIFGKYLQPINKKSAKFYTKNVFSFQNKDYHLGSIEIEHSPYMDWDNSAGVSAMFGTHLLFLIEEDNYYKIHFIKNKEQGSSKSAKENYWSMPQACCGGDNYFEYLHVGGNHIYVGWWNGSDGIDEPWEQDLYQIEHVLNKGFRIKAIKRVNEYKGAE